MFMNNGSNLLSAESIRLIKTVVQTQMSDASIEYGLIWNWRRIERRRYLGHTGNMPGVAHSFIINENGDTAAMILTNGDITFNADFSNQINDVLTKIQVSLIGCYE